MRSLSVGADGRAADRRALLDRGSLDRNIAYTRTKYTFSKEKPQVRCGPPTKQQKHTHIPHSTYTASRTGPTACAMITSRDSPHTNPFQTHRVELDDRLTERASADSPPCQLARTELANHACTRTGTPTLFCKTDLYIEFANTRPRVRVPQNPSRAPPARTRDPGISVWTGLLELELNGRSSACIQITSQADLPRSLRSIYMCGTICWGSSTRQRLS